jgi:hypothetical protein
MHFGGKASFVKSRYFLFAFVKTLTLTLTLTLMLMLTLRMMKFRSYFITFTLLGQLLMLSNFKLYPRSIPIKLFSASFTSMSAEPCP